MTMVRKIKELEKIIRDQAFVVKVQDKDLIAFRIKNENLRIHLMNIHKILIKWSKD